MRDLTVSLVQTTLQWESPIDNRQHFEQLLVDYNETTDLFVLPEMFTTGFSMNALANAEPVGGETYLWMQNLATQLDTAIAGSVAIEVDGQVFNRMLFASPQGITHYDKRHLFRMAGEHQRYAPGDDRVIVEWRDWRIKLEICYDLRFPVFSRNRGDYDLLLYVANWPGKRANHWRALLPARAIENLACVVGVNRIGTDAKGWEYKGDSLAIDAKGHIQLDMANDEGISSTAFSARALHEWREQFPADLDSDVFELKL